MDAVVVGGELPNPKPHKDAFSEVCRQIWCDLDECVYVGDHPINDVDGAIKAGMEAIWFRSVGIWMDQIPPAEYAVYTLGEVPDMIERVNRKRQ